MFTIHRYVTRSFLVTFAMALVVFTFVMCLQVVLRVTDLMAQGVSWQPIVRLLLLGVPSALAFSIPVSLLTASLLVFGHLSADGEITAMRTCGLSMWRISFGPLAVAVLFVALCLHINTELAPNSHFRRRDQMKKLGAEVPIQLLEEGVFIEDFPGFVVYIGKRQDSILRKVKIYDLSNPKIKRLITAESGLIRTNAMDDALVLELHDVRIDPFSEKTGEPARMSQWSVPIGGGGKKRAYRKREEDWSMAELGARIRSTARFFPELDEKDRDAQRMSLKVELCKRLVLSTACLAFVLLGIPLGIKAHRKESSIGMAISLALVFNFYLFIIVAESLAKRPEFRPDLIVWLPVAISVLLGSILICRSN